MPSPWRRWWYRLNHPGGVPARWFWAWVVLLVVLTNLNHLLGWLAQPEGSYYLGHGWVFNSLDYNTYVSKLQQGQLGLWHYFNWYTPENLPGSGFNLLYRATGWLTGPLGWSPLFAMTMLRLVVTVAVVHSLIRLVRLIEWTKRLWPWTMALCSLALPLGFLLAPEVGGVSLPEAGVMPSLAYVPHFSLGILALSEWLQIWVRQIQSPAPWSGRTYLELGAWVGVLSLVYPFALLLLLTMLMGVMVLNRWQGGVNSFPWRSVWIAVAIVLVWIGVYWMMTRLSPVYSRLFFGRSYLLLSPLFLLLELGPLGLGLLGVGAVRLWQRRVTDPVEQWLTAWWWATLVLFYSPLVAAPRLTLGWQIPSALLAVWYLQVYLGQRYRKVLIGLVGFVTLSSVWLIAYNALLVRASGFYHVSADTLEVLADLRPYSPGTQVILAEPEVSNYLPVLARQRVVFGNNWETVDALQQYRQVKRFFAHETEPDATILEDHGVDWVITDRGGESFLSDLILEDEVGQMRLYRVD